MVPVNRILLGNRVFPDVHQCERRPDWISTGLSPMTGVLIRRGPRDTQEEIPVKTEAEIRAMQLPQQILRTAGDRRKLEGQRRTLL